MPSPETVTIAEALAANFDTLLFAPLGQQGAHATAVQGLIQVDPRSTTPLARLLLHELFHVVRPMWSETRVRQWESKLWRSATWKEKAKLYKLLGKGRLWDGAGSIRPEHDERTTTIHSRTDQNVQAPSPAAVGGQTSSAELVSRS